MNIRRLAISIAQRVLVALIATALIVAAFGQERSFWPEPDPGFLIIDLAYHGGQTGRNSAYALYADGRLVAKRVRHTGEIVEEREFWVSNEELDALIQRIIEAGLLESNQELLEERMGPKRRVFGASDSPAMHITVALPRYQAPGESEAREVRVSLVTPHPFVVARSFENVPEIQGLDHIARWFRQYRSRGGGQ